MKPMRKNGGTEITIKLTMHELLCTSLALEYFYLCQDDPYVLFHARSRVFSPGRVFERNK